jgi:E3 ubiquitin-protein ligase TRIP12
VLRLSAPSSPPQGIINTLKQAEDETSQLSALTDLCELLSISTEDTMAIFPVEQVVPLLVRPRGGSSCVCPPSQAPPWQAGPAPSCCSAHSRQPPKPALAPTSPPLL